MKIFRNLEEIKDIEETVVATGNFDGVHIGHRELIKRAIDSARTAGMKSAVFTFTNHPKNVITKQTVVKNILSFADKVDIIRTFGIDYLFAVDFTESIAGITPEVFVTDILMKTLRMREVCCGFNYAFGNRGSGNPELLAKMSVREGFGLHILEPVKVENTVVNSTLIRELISQGDMQGCRKYLGRNYAIGGRVTAGNRIGRTIGFPTCNIILDQFMVTPSHGVYATLCEYKDKKYKSVTNVGLKPTVGSEQKTVETHIFDFSKDIYEKEIKVEFLKKLRDEKKFESIEALAAQIGRDCQRAKDFHDFRENQCKEF